MMKMMFLAFFIPIAALADFDPMNTDISDQATIYLGTVDRESLINEDQLNSKKGSPLRTGIHRPLQGLDIHRGEVEVLPSDLWIWRLRIVSDEALWLRIHFTDFDLPDGDTIGVYSSPADVKTYSGSGPYHNNNFWTESTDGDVIHVEWHHHLSGSNKPLSLPFRVEEVTHVYRDLFSSSEREGNCHNDATCDLSYRQQRDASAFIIFEDGAWQYICSGTMLNCSAANFTPYFITANHCISDDDVAQTLEVQFFYQTAVCDSGSATHGVRKYGAHLLAHGSESTQSDYSLLQLTATGFDGVYYAGWDRGSLSLNEAITSIHHPDGAYKRISYGTMTDTSDPNFWETTWNRTSKPGVTEPGSSGGGLFRDSNHRFVGQLYGGSSACGSSQYLPDYYGSFARSYTYGNLGQWLGNAQSIDGAYFNSGSPTNTPTPVQTSTPVLTPTPIPSITFTPDPTTTAMATSTPVFTPTPSCDVTGVKINMPGTDFYPGDLFYCDVSICNHSSAFIYDARLFVVLDVFGTYYFAPSFTSFDYIPADVRPDTTSITIVTPFNWPQIDSQGEATWYAGLTDALMHTVIGDIDLKEFTWNQ